MEVSLPKTNLQNELLKVKKRSSISKNQQLFNLEYDVSKLNIDNLFHVDQIRKICIDYRLRFLDVKLFKKQAIGCGVVIGGHTAINVMMDL